MRMAIIRFAFLGIFVAVLAWLLSGCAGLPAAGAAGFAPSSTSGAPVSPSLTPFLPISNPSAEISTALFTPSVPVPPTSLPSTSTVSSPVPSSSLPTPLPLLSRAQYFLSVSMDYGAHILTVSEKILYPNQTGGTLQDLVLAVEPNRWPGCLKLGKITIDGQAPMVSVLNGIRLRVTPILPIAPDQQVSLSLQYVVQLPEADSHQVFGVHDLQTNLVDWYPFIVPYAARQGWLIHEPANVGEHLVYDSVDFDITFQFTDPNPSIVIAASAPSDPAVQGWHYHLANARTFTLSLSPGYLSSSLRVGQMTVTSYYYFAQTTAGLAVLQQVAKAITTYNDLFGPVPTPAWPLWKRNTTTGWNTPDCSF
jgi:hypothetical protein